jgi:hypothetical protein
MCVDVRVILNESFSLTIASTKKFKDFKKENSELI